MLDKDYAVSSKVSFECDGTPISSKILHQIASGIRGDGLKVKRIAIFEKPFAVRIYINDVSSEAKPNHWLFGAFTPVRDPEDCDYVVCISIRQMPFFKLTCSYSIERHSCFQHRKSSRKRHFSLGVTHIRQSVSESISASLQSMGAKTLPSTLTASEAM